MQINSTMPFKMLDFLMRCTAAITFIVILLCLPLAVRAQCGGGTLAGNLTPTGSFQTVACVNAGQYYTFNATVGSTYTFSFCQGGGSAPFSFDTYLTITDNAGVPVAGAFNDNFCFPIWSEVTWTAPSTGTFRIRISLPAPGCGSNAICATMAYRGVAPFGPGTTCANPMPISSLPYTLNNVTTCGAGDDYSSAMTCTSTFMDGDDYVFRYTSPGNECINLSVTGTTNWVGLFVVLGCPNAGGSTCIAEAESGAGNPALSWVSLTAPGTYYFIVSTLPPPQCTPFNIHVELCPTGRTCADPRAFSTLPYVQNNLTTCGFGDDYSSADACNSTYMNGDDFVFAYTAASAQCIDVFLSNTSGWTGVFVLNGCPNQVGATCLGSNTSILGNPPLQGVSLPAAGTYYIVVSTQPSPQCTPFDIRVDTCTPPPPCGLNPPPEDLCLNAIDISGYTTFCGRTDSVLYRADIPGNLSSQFCATIENNAWFSFIADTTTISFFLGVNDCYFGDGIQARVFSTTNCNTFTAVSTCFNPGTQTSGSITATGLTVGQRYYLMIDGFARDDCEYSISWSGGPLPVTFSHVEAYTRGEEVVIQWKTSTETNNAGFWVERGRPGGTRELGGISWENIGTLPGGVNGSFERAYRLIDPAGGEGAFYRIRQVDLDGNQQYSEVVTVAAAGAPVGDWLVVWPNPAQDRCHFEFEVMEAAPVRLELFDLAGQRHRVLDAGRLDIGSQQVELSTADLAAGVYSYVLFVGNARKTGRLSVMH
jgi:hypothetical protein